MICRECFAWDSGAKKCIAVNAHDVPKIQREGYCPFFKTPEQAEADRKKAERKNKKMMRYEEKKCWLCGRNGSSDPLDRHHIFGGPNRKLSEKYGLTVYLCHDRCHIFGPDSVHRNREVADMVYQYGQKKAMRENNWSIDDFRRVFGRNFLD